MNLLSVENLSRSFGIRYLFEDLSFGVTKGQKIALIGRNGCGKTTLLRIIAGDDTPDTGQVTFRNNIRLEYLDQNPKFRKGQTVLDAVFDSGNEALQIIREYEALSEKPDPDPEKMQKVMDQIEHHKAWELEARVREVLGKLDIHNLDQQVDSLSGGQKKRIALARVLVSEPDLLILDEPTNHLDVEGIEWLENYLSTSSLTLLLVTHDRYFLDRVCNTIFELEDGEMFIHEGNYSYFLEKKADREANQDKVVDRANNLLRKELEWLRRQPKARTTKSKARIDSAHDLMDVASQKRYETSINMNFGTRRIGKKILEMESVSKAYGDLTLLDHFSYTFKRRERVGIVGPNGVGKTTFLDLITGKIKPDTGDIETGETIHFGYYTQSGLKFKEGQTVLDTIKEVAEHVQLANGDTVSAPIMLSLFGFPHAMHQTQVALLSGGEKRRLYLLRVLMAQPNFLILDEPTNDLDIITLNTLESFLENIPGCLVIVSHDRYFLDKLADTLLVFEGQGKIVNFPGNYRHYREWKEVKDAEEAAAAKETEKEKTERNWREQDKKKLSFNEKREFSDLEAAIPQLEEKIAELQNQINSGSSDYEALAGWTAELKKLESELEQKSDRWLELAEFAEN